MRWSFFRKRRRLRELSRERAHLYAHSNAYLSVSVCVFPVRSSAIHRHEGISQIYQTHRASLWRLRAPFTHFCFAACCIVGSIGNYLVLYTEVQCSTAVHISEACLLLSSSCLSSRRGFVILCNASPVPRSLLPTRMPRTILQRTFAPKFAGVWLKPRPRNRAAPSALDHTARGVRNPR